VVVNGSYMLVSTQASNPLHRPLVLGLGYSPVTSAQELPMGTPSKSDILSPTPPSAAGPARSDSKDRNLSFHFHL
jgi:hypothetical protein